MNYYYVSILRFLVHVSCSNKALFSKLKLMKHYLNKGPDHTFEITKQHSSDNKPDSAVIITIIPCPHIISANMNPEEIQISSLNVPLLKDVVIAKICPRVCSVLKHVTTKCKKRT